MEEQKPLLIACVQCAACRNYSSLKSRHGAVASAHGDLPALVQHVKCFLSAMYQLREQRMIDIKTQVRASVSRRLRETSKGRRLRRQGLTGTHPMRSLSGRLTSSRNSLHSTRCIQCAVLCAISAAHMFLTTLKACTVHATCSSMHSISPNKKARLKC